MSSERLSKIFINLLAKWWNLKEQNKTYVSLSDGIINRPRAMIKFASVWYALLNFE